MAALIICKIGACQIGIPSSGWTILDYSARLEIYSHYKVSYPCSVSPVKPAGVPHPSALAEGGLLLNTNRMHRGRVKRHRPHRDKGECDSPLRAVVYKNELFPAGVDLKLTRGLVLDQPLPHVYHAREMSSSAANLIRLSFKPCPQLFLENFVNLCKIKRGDKI